MAMGMSLRMRLWMSLGMKIERKMKMEKGRGEGLNGGMYSYGCDCCKHCIKARIISGVVTQSRNYHTTYSIVTRDMGRLYSLPIL